MAVRAVVLIPDGSDIDRREWITECEIYCARNDNSVVGFARTWNDAAFMVLHGEADVVIAARAEHFPADRVPRAEVAGEPPTDPSIPPRSRRARWLRS